MEETHRYVSPEELMARSYDAAPAPSKPQVSFLDMPDEPYADPRQLSMLFKALANETRLEIVQLLEVQASRIGDMAAALDVPGNHLARHLRILERAGAITRERYVYSINPTILPLLKAAVCHIFSPRP